MPLSLRPFLSLLASPFAPPPIRVFHWRYGHGVFLRLLPECGQARVVFDIDDCIPRRVQTRDLTPERGPRLVEDRELVA